MARRCHRVSDERCRQDSGSVLVLMLGLVVLAALLIVVVVDVSALFMARRDLLAATDGAALAGAQAVDEAAVYREGVHGALPLDPVRVHAEVEQYLRDSSVAALVDDLQWQVVVNGTDVHVTVAARVQLPVVNAITGALAGADAVDITASATARSAVLP